MIQGGENREVRFRIFGSKLARLGAILTMLFFLAPFTLVPLSPKASQYNMYLASLALLLPSTLMILLIDQLRNLRKRRWIDTSTIPATLAPHISSPPVLITPRERLMELQTPILRVRQAPAYLKTLRAIKQVLTDPLVTSRLLIFTLIILAPFLLPLPARGLTPVAGNVQVPYIYPVARWDSYYYLRIAKEGYSTISGWRAFAFRPLFPLILGVLFQGFPASNQAASETLAAIAWNLVAIALAGFYMEKLTRLFLGPKVARRTLLLLAVYPSTFFLSVVYTEATTILLVVMSIYYFETRRTLQGGLLGFLAGLARPETFLLSGAFFIKGLVSPTTRLTRLKIMIASAITFLSFPAFLVFSYAVTGSFMTPAHVEAGWQKCSLVCFMASPAHHFWSPTNTWPFLINFVVMGLSIIFIAGAFIMTNGKRRISDRLFPYYLWSLALLGIIFYIGEVRSWARFQLGLPAVFWAQAKIGVMHPRLFYLLLLSYAGLMIMATVLFADWYPML